MKPKKVAIVAEWLTWRGGGEVVLDALLEIFPKADLFTTVYNEKKLPEYKKFHPKTSFLQKIPVARARHQAVPPLLLSAISSLDLSGHDLIISSSSSIGKGIKKPKGAVHICYCHTPMRYVWQTDIDRRLIDHKVGRHFINYLKKWDLTTNKGIDYFLTNSNYTKDRIKKYYNRDATVIYPPVSFPEKLKTNTRKDFYLCLSRLIPYKRIDLAVEACGELGKKLIVAGDGPEMARLKELDGPMVEFVGRVEDKEKFRLLSEAKALIFPADEDFGIVPIEAMASGTPVIAYNKGGIIESVRDGKNGVLFEEQTIPSLKAAIRRFETLKFNRNFIKQSTKRFSKNEFTKKIKGFIEKI